MDIANNLFMTAQAASGTAANNIWMTAQAFQNGFGCSKRLHQMVSRRISPATLDSRTNIDLRLVAKTGQFGHLAFLAGLFQLLDGVHSQLIMQRFDLFWAKARNFEKF